MTIEPGRLNDAALAENFADIHPSFNAHEAMVAADRCYFCHDAPCITACPTAIDIPLFIRQIAGGRPSDAALTIFDQNILGGMCARVCPTETLCEGACVREAAEGKPVEIGRLQRFATDTLLDRPHPFVRAADTGKRVAVAGAGPAGLAAAHRLALHGHQVDLFEARAKAGGLNEYGIAAYKTVDDFAATELDWLLGIGGIAVQTGKSLEDASGIAALQSEYDAVVLAIGLGGVNALRAEGEALAGVLDAVDFIEDVRQKPLSSVPVGRDVMVIGGGMTAIDAAVQSRGLGAETVTIAYRRSRAEMPASRHEQEHATSRGVTIRENLAPLKIADADGRLAVTLEYTRSGPDGLTGTGETVTLIVDQVMKAIGQSLHATPAGLELAGSKIAVDEQGRTSLAGVWAAGDCAAGGDDLTVTAVAEGRDVAEAIHAGLSA